MYDLDQIPDYMTWYKWKSLKGIKTIAAVQISYRSKAISLNIHQNDLLFSLLPTMLRFITWSYHYCICSFSSDRQIACFINHSTPYQTTGAFWVIIAIIGCKNSNRTPGGVSDKKYLIQQFHFLSSPLVSLRKRERSNYFRYCRSQACKCIKYRVHISVWRSCKSRFYNGSVFHLDW